MIDGRKVAGGAQKRSRGYLLHQGSIAWPILLEYTSHLEEEDFKCRFAEALSRMFQSRPVYASLTDLNAV